MQDLEYESDGGQLKFTHCVSLAKWVLKVEKCGWKLAVR